MNTPFGVACVVGWGGCGYTLCWDGAAANPAPADGYACTSPHPEYLLCVDDNGVPGNSTSPTCA